MGEGIKLSCVHKKCGEKKLIDYIGYVYCDFCEEIVEPNDILDIPNEEEYKKYIKEKKARRWRTIKKNKFKGCSLASLLKYGKIKRNGGD